MSGSRDEAKNQNKPKNSVQVRTLFETAQSSGFVKNIDIEKLLKLFAVFTSDRAEQKDLDSLAQSIEYVKDFSSDGKIIPTENLLRFFNKSERYVNVNLADLKLHQEEKDFIYGFCIDWLLNCDYLGTYLAYAGKENKGTEVGYKYILLNSKMIEKVIDTLTHTRKNLVNLQQEKEVKQIDFACQQFQKLLQKIKERAITDAKLRARREEDIVVAVTTTRKYEQLKKNTDYIAGGKAYEVFHQQVLRMGQVAFFYGFLETLVTSICQACGLHKLPINDPHHWSHIAKFFQDPLTELNRRKIQELYRIVSCSIAPDKLLIKLPQDIEAKTVNDAFGFFEEQGKKGGLKDHFLALFPQDGNVNLTLNLHPDYIQTCRHQGKTTDELKQDDPQERVSLLEKIYRDLSSQNRQKRKIQADLVSLEYESQGAAKLDQEDINRKWGKASITVSPSTAITVPTSPVNSTSSSVVTVTLPPTDDHKKATPPSSRRSSISRERPSTGSSEEKHLLLPEADSIIAEPKGLSKKMLFLLAVLAAAIIVGIIFSCGALSVAIPVWFGMAAPGITLSMSTGAGLATFFSVGGAFGVVGTAATTLGTALGFSSWLASTLSGFAILSAFSLGFSGAVCYFRKSIAAGAKKLATGAKNLCKYLCCCKRSAEPNDPEIPSGDSASAGLSSLTQTEAPLFVTDSISATTTPSNSPPQSLVTIHHGGTTAVLRRTSTIIPRSSVLQVIEPLPSDIEPLSSDIEASGHGGPLFQPVPQSVVTKELTAEEYRALALE